MKKFFKIFKFTLCVTLVAILSFLIAGCNNSRVVTKASKGLNNYLIDAVYCDSEHKISAKEQVTYKNTTGKTVDKIYFNLYGNGFLEGNTIKPYTKLNQDKCFPNGISYGGYNITSVRVNKINASFEVGGDNKEYLVVNVEPLENKKSVIIEIVFELKLANCNHRLGYIDDFVNLGNWYPILCEFDGEKFVTIPYYSTGDPFYSSVANYNVTITVPQDYKLASTGKIKDFNTADYKTTYNIKAEAVRDFACSLSKNFNVVSTTLEGLTFNVYGNLEQDVLNKYLQLTTKAMQFFNDKFGEYPYSVINVAFTPFLHGGMEYPNFVLVANDIADELNITKVIVHELAHQWWYSLVGNNEVEDAWIDESLAEYSTLMFFEQNDSYGVTREKFVTQNKNDYLIYLDVMNSVNNKINTQMNLPVSKYSSEYEYVYMVYVKGVLFLDDLRNKVGDKNFENGLKQFYKQNKFKIAKTSDFIDAFEKTTNLNLQEFFNDWLSGAKIVE